MFVGSDRGGDRAAVFYTLIESAKLNGLDPEAYIAAVIDRMAKGHTSKALDALLPWNFKPTQANPTYYVNQGGLALTLTVFQGRNTLLMTQQNHPRPRRIEPKSRVTGTRS